MICIVVMVVFGIMGIFSATHRRYFWEALDCTLRMLTLRPCKTNLDQRIKSRLTAKLMIKYPKLARFTHKNFQVISIIFVVLFFVSIIWTGYSVYNLAVYKSCDPQHPDKCVFTPKSDECGSWKCWFHICNCGDTCGTKVGEDCEGENCNTPK